MSISEVLAVGLEAFPSTVWPVKYPFLDLMEEVSVGMEMLADAGVRQWTRLVDPLGAYTDSCDTQ
jgi:hypothetical protein